MPSELAGDQQDGVSEGHATVSLRIGIAVESSLWGGLETHAVDLAGVLAARGHRPIVIASDHHTLELFRARSHAPLELQAVPSFTTTGTTALLAALRRLSLDACVFEKGTLHAGSFAFDLAARMSCRRFITIQQLLPAPLPPASARRLAGVPSPNIWRRRLVMRGRLRSLLPFATVCVSDAVAVALRQDYQFPARKLVTVRNGVDVKRFREDPAARVRARANWQVGDDAVVFGVVCRLVPDKAVEVALEAFRRVAAESRRPAHLVIVGEGPNRQGLEASTKAFGLNGQVRFLGFRTDIPAVLSAVDFLVLSSRVEGLPLVVVEALATGRPVIATRVAGTPEVLNHPDLGWLVPPDDTSALTSVMHEALAAPESRVSAMRVAARRHAVENFSAESQYVRIAELIETGR